MRGSHRDEDRLAFTCRLCQIGREPDAAAAVLAQQLVRARDVNEMVKLQSDYITAQIKTLSEQAKELSESTTKLAREATKPKS